MAPSSMHGMRKSHDGSAASLHGSPTLLESSSRPHVEVNDRPSTKVLELHQMNLNLIPTFQR